MFSILRKSTPLDRWGLLYVVVLNPSIVDSMTAPIGIYNWMKDGSRISASCDMATTSTISWEELPFGPSFPCFLRSRAQISTDGMVLIVSGAAVRSGTPYLRKPITRVRHDVHFYYPVLHKFGEFVGDNHR